MKTVCTPSNPDLHLRAPWLADGCSRYGAQMGRPSYVPDDKETIETLLVERVPLYDYGCYDKGGAYWGQGAPLFCAWGDSATEQAEIYFRAKDLRTAKQLMKERFPAATVSNRRKS